MGDGGGYVIPRGPGDLLRDCHEGESAGLLLLPQLLLLHGKDDDVGMEAAAAVDADSVADAEEESPPI